MCCSSLSAVLTTANDLRQLGQDGRHRVALPGHLGARGEELIDALRSERSHRVRPSHGLDLVPRQHDRATNRRSQTLWGRPYAAATPGRVRHRCGADASDAAGMLWSRHRRGLYLDGMSEGPAFRAVVRFDGRTWKVRADRADGTPAGWFQSSGLDLVVAKTRDLVEVPAAEVSVEVGLPAETEQALQLAEQLVEDATRELEGAIIQLRATGVSVADIGYIFMSRRLRPDPSPFTITTAEIARDGLPSGIVGVIWSDHGHGLTRTCRACVEGPRRRLYTAWQSDTFDPAEAFSADEEHELVRKGQRFECDFAADHDSVGSWVG